MLPRVSAATRPRYVARCHLSMCFNTSVALDSDWQQPLRDSCPKRRIPQAGRLRQELLGNRRKHTAVVREEVSISALDTSRPPDLSAYEARASGDRLRDVADDTSLDADFGGDGRATSASSSSLRPAQSAAGVHGPDEVALLLKRDFLLRMSQAIEDDPEMARKFSKVLALTENDGARLASACQEKDDSVVSVPSRTQLRQVCLASALPFLGFGIIDNAMMIGCGDMVDVTVCATFGLSTMAAAGLGNTMSDAFGVLTGTIVKDMAAKIGVETPPLSVTQLTMPQTKSWDRLGQFVGMTVGCLIGMFPLCFIDTKEQEAMKRQKSLDLMYDRVVVAVEDLLQAEAAMLALVDHSGHGTTQCIHSHSIPVQSAEGCATRIRMDEGVIGAVMQTGQFLNIADIRARQSRSYYNPKAHDDFLGTGIVVKSCLCMPILGHDEETGKCDKVMGVVFVINKLSGGQFDQTDEDALAAICSHISSSLSFVHGEERAFEGALENCARALRTTGTRINAAANRRVHDLYVSVVQEVARIHEASCVDLLTVNLNDMRVMALASTADHDRFMQPSDDFVPMSTYPAMMHAINRGRAYIINQPDPGLDGLSVLCCPILDGYQEIIGGINVTAKEPGQQFTAKDVERLNAVSNKIALTMEGNGSSLTRLLQTLRSSR